MEKYDHNVSCFLARDLYIAGGDRGIEEALCLWRPWYGYEIFVFGTVGLVDPRVKLRCQSHHHISFLCFTAEASTEALASPLAKGKSVLVTGEQERGALLMGKIK